MRNIYLLKSRFASKLFILFTALQLMACSLDENPLIPPPTEANHPAIITGVDSGIVTEDVGVDTDNMLKAGGTLAITDIDTGEDAFVAISIEGTYGSLSISADGTWNYSADNKQVVIQNLASGKSLSDSFTVSSIDGTQHTVAITIKGADEVVAPIIVTDPVVVPDTTVTDPVVVPDTTVTDPVVPDTTVTDPVVPDTTVTDPVVPATNNLNLTWIAPSAREDNTPLSLSAIGGYKIYYGTTQGKYTSSVNVNDGSATSYTFNDLPVGTYYFVITTYDTDGRESKYSTEFVMTI